MRRAVALGILWVGLIAAGVAVGTYSLWQTQNRFADRNYNRLVSGELLLEIWSDKARYLSGENVRLFAVLHNVGSNAIVYFRPTPCHPDFDVIVRSGFGDTPLFEGGRDPPVCIQVISERVLEPGQEIQRNLTWNQDIWAYEKWVKAPAGRYEIVAVFMLGYPERAFRELTVSIWVEIRA